MDVCDCSCVCVCDMYERRVEWANNLTLLSLSLSFSFTRLSLDSYFKTSDDCMQ